MSKGPVHDRELFTRLQAGERSALRALFDRFYQILLALAINILHDVEAAKDVVQEIFVMLWQKRASLNIPDHPEAYLKRTTINRAYNAIKRRKRYTDLTVLADEPSRNAEGEELTEAADLEVIVQSALEKLPTRCREVFVLKRMEGYSLKEIAAKLDISPKTVENQMTKALKLLKEALLPYVE